MKEGIIVVVYGSAQWIEEEHGPNTIQCRTGRFILATHTDTRIPMLYSQQLSIICFFYHVLAHYSLWTRNRLGQQPQPFLNGPSRPCIGGTRYNEIKKRGARHFSAR